MALNRNQLKFLEALPRNNWNIARACRDIGISRRAYYKWMKKDEEFADRMKDLEEEDLDNAEEALRMLRTGVPRKDEDGNITGFIMYPNAAAIIFYLKTKGKIRGYSEDGFVPDPDRTVFIERADEEANKERLKRLEAKADKYREEIENDEESGQEAAED